MRQLPIRSRTVGANHKKQIFLRGCELKREGPGRRVPAVCQGGDMSDTGGYFPRWRLKTQGRILPDERLPAGQTAVLGLQHVVAMFGSTVLAPLIMGFDPNVSILFSGISTLIFFIAVGGRVPSYIGSWQRGQPPGQSVPISRWRSAVSSLPGCFMR